MVGRLRETGGARLHAEPGDDVRPLLLGAHALLRQGLDAVSDHGAGIGLDAVLDDALVVIDEEPAQVHERLPVFQLQELQRPGQRVARTTAELTLVLYGRTGGSQISLGGQGGPHLAHRRVEDVALIRQVGDPAEPDFARRVVRRLRRPRRLWHRTLQCSCGCRRDAGRRRVVRKFEAKLQRRARSS